MSKLAELEREKIALNTELDVLTKTYKASKSMLDNEIKKVESKIRLQTSEIILEKVENVSDVLMLKGLKNCGVGDTEKIIKEAITKFSTESGFFGANYLGCKDYAQWSCQGVNFQYGYGPRHGTVVFEIGIKRDFRQENFGKYIEDILAVLHYVLKLTSDGKRDLLMDIQTILEN